MQIDPPTSIDSLILLCDAPGDSTGGVPSPWVAVRPAVGSARNVSMLLAEWCTAILGVAGPQERSSKWPDMAAAANECRCCRVARGHVAGRFLGETAPCPCAPKWFFL